MLLEEEASKLLFTLRFLKMKFSSSLMLKNFSSHLTWKLSWMLFHKWSPLFQWTWTRLNFPLQQSLPWCTTGYETWFTGATLIEIGVYVDSPCTEFLRTLSKSRKRKKFHCHLFLQFIILTFLNCTSFYKILEFW